MKRLTPVQSIRKKCLECQGGRYSLVRKCAEFQCSLYRYRMGKRPKITAKDNCSKVVR